MRQLYMIVAQEEDIKLGHYMVFAIYSVDHQ